MKILYIESKLKNINLVLSPEEMKKLPKRLFLAYSIQYKEIANYIRKALEKNKIQVIGIKQVLGCTRLNIKEPILLIGSGRFHAMNLLLQTKDIYIFENNLIIKMPYHDIESLKMKLKTSLIKFLNAENIGIITSTKPGQGNLELALKLKEKLEKKKKNVFIFISNNINIAEFENFNIDSWVNTACAGLTFDSPEIINYIELKEQKLI